MTINENKPAQFQCTAQAIGAIIYHCYYLLVHQQEIIIRKGNCKIAQYPQGRNSFFDEELGCISCVEKKKKN